MVGRVYQTGNIDGIGTAARMGTLADIAVDSTGKAYVAGVAFCSTLTACESAVSVEHIPWIVRLPASG